MNIAPLYKCQSLGKPLDGNVGECQIPAPTYRYHSSVQYYYDAVKPTTLPACIRKGHTAVNGGHEVWTLIYN